LFSVPALAAVLEYVWGKKNPDSAGRIAILGATATCGLAIAIANRTLHGVHLTALGHQLYADGLSALVALIVSVVGLITTMYAYSSLRHEVKEGKIPRGRLPLYFVLTLVFISTMGAVTVTNNIIMMYVLVEATTLASALLVTYYWQPESLEAGYKYMLLCSVGIIVGLLGCVVFYSAAVPFVGGSKAMLITEVTTVAGRFPPAVSLIGGALIIIGFGSKAGLVPFHAWLPDAHSQSPSPMSALLSGVTIKVAVYAVARIASMASPAHTVLGTYCVVLGMVSMLVGIFCAFAQADLKRLLAFHSVSQMGYVIMGFGIGSYLGIYGGVYHLLNHTLFKSLLFLCSGALLYAHGTTNIHELSGKKHDPLVAVLFFMGALAMGGLPPLNGFFSKFTIFVAAAQARLWWAFGIGLFTSFATLACLVKAGYEIFLTREPERVSAPVFAETTVAAAATVSGKSYSSQRRIAHAALSAPAFAPVAAAAVAGRTKGCPGAMAVAMVTMALLVLASGFDCGVLNRLIDLSARALLNR
jgi:hydrogenase-4 component F